MDAPIHASDRPGSQRAVLRQLVLHGPMSRTEISHRTSFTSATISRAAGRLLDEGLVRELPTDEGERAKRQLGRRRIDLDTVPEWGQVLGIGIGPTFQTVTLTDLKSQVIAGDELQLERLDDPDPVIDRIAGASRALVTKHGADRRLLGCFVMVSGAVDPVTGVIQHAPYLGWSDVPLQAKLSTMLHLPVQVETMPIAIALAEARFGAARGYEDVLALNCGLGVSAGLVLNGRIIRGRSSSAGIIGLGTAFGGNGRTTTLDQLAGGFCVLQQLHGRRTGAPRPFTGEAAQALLEAIAGDRREGPVEVEVMTEAGRELGRIAVQLVRFVAPEVVVIAGPLSMAPSYVAAARAAIEAELATSRIEVMPGIFGGPVEAGSATCWLAICKYLFEGEEDRAALHAGTS